MIGNDIIALQVAAQESRINRKGFLEKLFLPEEIQLIYHSPDPATTTWLLWSCKEAVYKIIHRYTRERIYAPQRFHCHLQQQESSAASGTVVYEQQTCYFKSTITADYIHTYAAIAPALLNKMDIFANTMQHHLSTPQRIQPLLSNKELFCKNEAGIPYILHRDTGEQLPISVSHHGNYLAFVKLSHLEKV